MNVICTRCGVPKRPEDFSRHPRKRNGLQSWCKRCKADAMTEAREMQAAREGRAYGERGQKRAKWANGRAARVV